jgi:hypothetical protein
MIIRKALYGLCSLGARFHDRLVQSLRQLGFIQCHNEQDIWLHDCGNHNEYICVYMDDLVLCSCKPLEV